jgi:TBC1 domain family member 15
MDLQSTLIRAESLYRRFQRTVDTIDKKDNFPSAPQARQRKPATSPPASSQASSSGTDQAKQLGTDTDARVISPELRSLLSKKVEKLDKSDVAKHGGGVEA